MAIIKINDDEEEVYGLILASETSDAKFIVKLLQKDLVDWRQPKLRGEIQIKIPFFFTFQQVSCRTNFHSMQMHI